MTDQRMDGDAGWSATGANRTGTVKFQVVVRVRDRNWNSGSGANLSPLARDRMTRTLQLSPAWLKCYQKCSGIRVLELRP